MSTPNGMTDLQRAGWAAVAELAEIQRLNGEAPSTTRVIRDLVNALAPMPAFLRELSRAGGAK